MLHMYARRQNMRHEILKYFVGKSLLNFLKILKALNLVNENPPLNT